MIKPGEAYARRARDVAHGSRVITLFRENPRGGAQDQFQLLIVARQVRFRISNCGFRISSSRVVSGHRISYRNIRRNSKFEIRISKFSEPYVFKLKRLALDARGWRRDPIRD